MVGHRRETETGQVFALAFGAGEYREAATRDEPAARGVCDEIESAVEGDAGTCPVTGWSTR